MTNKEIREERIKGYFITAAMEIIRAEGLQAASARTIAERAGYSYATIYNYFKDIRDLIFSSVELFMDECRNFVKDSSNTELSGQEQLQDIGRCYGRFFVQYPAIFTLLFTENPANIGAKGSNYNKVENLFDSIVETVSEEKYDSSQFTNYKYALHGLLLFALTRKAVVDYKELMAGIDDLLF